MAQTKNYFLVLATDGLWDVHGAADIMSQFDRGSKLRNFSFDRVAPLVTDLCKESWSQRLKLEERADDTTVIGAFFQAQTRAGV